jgi:hypothetical protein
MLISQGGLPSKSGNEGNDKTKRFATQALNCAALQGNGERFILLCLAKLTAKH